MLGRRLLTAAVGGPLLLGVIVYGGLPFLALACLAAGYGSFELLLMLRRAGFAPVGGAMVGLSAALPLLAGIAQPNVELLALAVVLIATLCIAAWESPLRSAPDWALTVSGALLVGGLLRFLVALRELPDGLWWALAVVVGTWACDTGAYTVGRLVGRTPLAPRVSPGKTAEGVLGALIVTPLAFVGMQHFAPFVGLASPVSTPTALAIGALVALFATAGDLSESVIKRQCGVKDSGVLLPGHGGLLDRIDSLLFAGVAGYGAAIVIR